MFDDTTKHFCSCEISITDSSSILFSDKESSEGQVIHAVSLDSDTVVFTGMLLLKSVCLVSGLLSLVCFTGFDGNTVGSDSSVNAPSKCTLHILELSLRTNLALTVFNFAYPLAFNLRVFFWDIGNL